MHLDGDIGKIGQPTGFADERPVDDARQGALGRLATLAWRSCRLHCPHCGSPGIFTTWFRMRAECPRCGLDLERREQGYVVGAYMLNIVAAEGIFLVMFLGVLVVTWPDPPWQALRYAAPALMLVIPLVTYPFSKTFFLAMDLAVRPVGRE